MRISSAVSKIHLESFWWWRSPYPQGCCCSDYSCCKKNYKDKNSPSTTSVVLFVLSVWLLVKRTSVGWRDFISSVFSHSIGSPVLWSSLCSLLDHFQSICIFFMLWRPELDVVLQLRPAVSIMQIFFWRAREVLGCWNSLVWMTPCGKIILAV